MWNDLVPRGDHIICGKCSREIYVKKEDVVKLKCPKCGEVADSNEFSPADSCCCPD
jgi:predicted RNA-binding Zn-ribbon protein involved in translation (DUF1610 family)